MPSSVKHFTEDSARRLVSNIIDYWVSQGYPRKAIDVRTEIENSDAVVRSNLRGGKPPGKAALGPKPW